MKTPSKKSRSRKRIKKSELKFIRKFSKEGKQGLTGIIKYKGSKVVYKTSRYLNYTTKHEYYVMKSLQDVNKYCPYFCKALELTELDISPNFRDLDNPFEVSHHKYSIKKDFLLMELIRGKNLYSLVKKPQINDRIIFSALKNTLCAIQMAQNSVKFTHYDLHSSNIIMIPCEEDSVNLFISDNSVVHVPTYGTIPKIIDFGFSFSDEIKHRNILCSLAHTDIGFLSHMHDPHADAKLFLVSLAYESQLHRARSKYFKLFRKLVRKIYEPLKVDSNSGWDDGYTKLSAIDTVTDLLSDIKPKSQILDRYSHFSLDIIQSMIHLPLRGKNTKQLGTAFIAIDMELCKLEKEIGSAFYNLYIFKQIVKAAHKLKTMYSDPKKRKQAVKMFKKQIFIELDKISKYCMPTLNYEKLLCALLVYAEAVEGVLFRSCRDTWLKKSKDYEKLKYQNINQILNTINKYLPDNYSFTKETVIKISDARNKTYSECTLSDNQVNILNNTPVSDRNIILLGFVDNEVHKEENEDREQSSGESENEEDDDDEQAENEEDDDEEQAEEEDDEEQAEEEEDDDEEQSSGEAENEEDDDEEQAENEEDDGDEQAENEEKDDEEDDGDEHAENDDDDGDEQAENEEDDGDEQSEGEEKDDEEDDGDEHAENEEKDDEEDDGDEHAENEEKDDEEDDGDEHAENDDDNSEHADNEVGQDESSEQEPLNQSQDEEEQPKEEVVKSKIKKTTGKRRGRKPDYSKYKMSELTQIARDRNLRGWSTLRKKDLIEFLKAN